MRPAISASHRGYKSVQVKHRQAMFFELLAINNGAFAVRQR